MMNNIFTIFDPSTSPLCSLNWISLIIGFIFLPFPFWIYQTRLSVTWTLMFNFILKEFKILINYSYSNLIIFLSLFSFIFLNNFLGLFPFIFTSSSHMSLCLTLSLPLWLGMMTFSIYSYFNDLCSHLTPQGTPLILMPFMVIIESISLMIRPFTLAIRLTANMIAGHLLMSLLGSSGISLNLPMIPLLLFTQILLLILEMSVSIIQAYVFSILSTLYSSEI